MCQWLLLLFFCGVLVCPPSAMSQTDFRVLTENYPPFNYLKDGKLHGLSSEVVVRLMQRLGVKAEVEMLPWHVAYRICMEKPGTVLFSTTRTPWRENLFKWVGPLAQNPWCFFARADRDIVINSPEDARRYIIGSYRNDAAEQFLKQEGFDQELIGAELDTQNPTRLMLGEIDLWICGKHQAPMKMVQAGYKAEDIRIVYTVENTWLYIAFNRSTPDDEIARWQKALDDMKADGSYQEILSRYLGDE